MSILIVGADQIKAITPKLEDRGISRITHWTARKKVTSKFTIPQHIEAVIFFTDFLHHIAARKIKAEAKKRNLPTIFCRRASSELIQKIEILNQQLQSKIIFSP